MTAKITPPVASNTNASSVAAPSQKVIWFGVAIVVALIGWQYKATKPWVTGLAVLVLLGLVLSHWSTIYNQFNSLGSTAKTAVTGKAG